MIVDLAISPCPNDTFLFYWLAQRGLSEAPVELHFADVEELNRRALGEARHLLTKLSYFAFLNARDRYTLLAPGGAMGRGCGPLLVARTAALARTARQAAHSIGAVLVPGRWTTANLLSHLYLKDAGARLESVDFKESRYDQIIAQLLSGAADYGVIIHEERFTFEERGLHLVCDLGAWWEAETAAPIPLGCIAMRNDAPGWLAGEIEEAIRESLREARRSPGALMPFIKTHSQSLSDAVIAQHIALYVNDFSLDPGAEGQRAFEELLRRSQELPLLLQRR